MPNSRLDADLQDPPEVIPQLLKKLDEGFDIPMCNEAYITASSSNERQWIQRRGRILRTAKGKTSAIVHDFVITKTSDPKAFQSLVAKEIERMVAFSRYWFFSNVCLARQKYTSLLYPRRISCTGMSNTSIGISIGEGVSHGYRIFGQRSFQVTSRGRSHYQSRRSRSDSAIGVG